jgi:hypothetical protein
VKERMVAIILFPAFFIAAYVVVNFWVHHENILDHLNVYIARTAIALSAGIAINLFIYKKVYFDRIRQLKENLKEIQGFNRE